MLYDFNKWLENLTKKKLYQEVKTLVSVFRKWFRKSLFKKWLKLRLFPLVSQCASPPFPSTHPQPPLE